MTAFAEHTLLPLPGDVTFRDDCLEIDGEFRIGLTGVDDPRLALATERFAQDVRQLTGSRVSAALGGVGEARLVIRLLEIPTPTWLAHDSAFYGIELPDDAVLVHQERAYTSPIWYAQ